MVDVSRAQWQRPTLVLRDEKEVGEQQSQVENQDRLAACQPLLIRNAGPGMVDPCGSPVSARPSNVACACPELSPRAEEPLMVTDGNRLNRVTSCGPNVVDNVTSVRNGTISPVVLRTWRSLIWSAR